MARQLLTLDSQHKRAPARGMTYAMKKTKLIDGGADPWDNCIFFSIIEVRLVRLTSGPNRREVDEMINF